MKHLKIVEDHRASKGIRFANYIIDIIIFYIIIVVIFAILMITSPAFGSWISEDSILQRFVSILLYALYMILIEIITGGRSIGKFITGTRVIMINGDQPSAWQLLVRNSIRGIALIDQLSFFGDNGLHDSWSNTRVINIKNYTAEKQRKEEINSIGTK